MKVFVVATEKNKIDQNNQHTLISNERVYQEHGYAKPVVAESNRAQEPI